MWEPIKRGTPKVRGIHPAYSGLLEVDIALVGDIDDYWRSYFVHPVEVPMSLSMHPPQLNYDEVYLTPPDGEVETYVAHVDARIDSANERYRRERLPAVERQQAAAAEARDEEARRLAEAQRKLDEM